MAGDVLRPALGDVLAALTDTAPEQWAPESYRVTSVTTRWVGRRHPPRGMGVDGGVPLVVTDPREALEILQTRGIAPEDDERRFFRCACDGKPIVTPARGGQAIPYCVRCGYYDEPSAPQRPEYAVPNPQTIPDLVAWASLGTAAILRAEELARDLQRRRWVQNERVVWRVRRRLPGDVAAWRRSPWTPDHIDGIDHGHAQPRGVGDIWLMGLAIDSITDDAITLVVPPISGAP